LASGCLSLSPLTLKNLLNLLSEFLVLSSSVPEFPAVASLASSTSLCLKNLFFSPALFSETSLSLSLFLLNKLNFLFLSSSVPSLPVVPSCASSTS